MVKDNYVLPDYFFEKAALKLGLRRDVVEAVYNNYLINLSKALDKEGNVYMTGLGTLTAQPKGIGVMIKNAKMLENHFQKTGLLHDPKYEYCYEAIETTWQKMRKVEKKYEYIKRGLEKFRANLGRFEEFFDNDGYYRRDSKEKKGNLQELPLQLEECQNLP